MSASIYIRKGTAADLPAVHDLVRELAIYERAEAEFVATLDTYERDFAAGIFELLIAEQAGKVVGMMLFYLSYSTWKGRMLYLEDFVVRTSERRSGIGGMLFKALIERARLLECKLIKWQVLDWNEPAIQFYKKLGASIESDWYNGKLFLE